MALSLGATTPTALYLGTTAISAAYLGATQVYTTGGGDAYAIGGASPELVAAFTTQSDGTTAGEYYRKASSETTFSGLFTHSVSGLLTMFDSSGTLCYAPHNLFPGSENWAGWTQAGATTGQADLIGGANALLLTNSGSTAYTQDFEGNTVSGWQYTYRFLAKAGTANTVVFRNRTHDGTNDNSTFTLTGAGSASIHAGADGGSITALSDGWYLCEQYVTAGGVYQNLFAVDLLVSGTVYVFAPHAFVSNVPVADNPDQTVAGLEKYVPTTTAAKYLPRRQAYRYNSGWTLAGMQMEAAAATNLFDYSTDFSNAAWAKTRGAISSDAATGLDGNTGNFLFTCNTTSGLGAFLADTVSVSSGTRYCFWAVLEYSNVQWIHLRVNDGSAIGGWFDIQNGATGSTTGSETNGIGIVPIGSGKYLCYVDFTPNATTSATFYAWIAAGGDGTLNCVSGDAFYCYHMQMEVGSVPSSPIITTGSTVTRAAETLSIAGADTPANTTAMSVSMKGLMTYADNGAAAQETFLRWYADANNYITLDLDTDSTATGEVNANQSTAGTLDTVVAGAEYSPGVNVAFNIASRHTSGAVNVAKDGTAATADTTPTALADLSSTTLQMGQAFNGYISEFRMWGADIGDTGIAEVTS